MPPSSRRPECRTAKAVEARKNTAGSGRLRTSELRGPVQREMADITNLRAHIASDAPGAAARVGLSPPFIVITRPPETIQARAQRRGLDANPRPPGDLHAQTHAYRRKPPGRNAGGGSRRQ